MWNGLKRIGLLLLLLAFLSSSPLYSEESLYNFLLSITTELENTSNSLEQKWNENDQLLNKLGMNLDNLNLKLQSLENQTTISYQLSVNNEKILLELKENFVTQNELSLLQSSIMQTQEQIYQELENSLKDYGQRLIRTENNLKLSKSIMTVLVSAILSDIILNNLVGDWSYLIGAVVGIGIEVLF